MSLIFLLLIILLWFLPFVEVLRTREADWLAIDKERGEWATILFLFGIFGAVLYLAKIRPQLVTEKARLIPYLKPILIIILVAIALTLVVSTTSTSSEVAKNVNPDRLDLKFGEGASFDSGLQVTVSRIIDPIEDGMIDPNEGFRYIGVVTHLGNSSTEQLTALMDSWEVVLGTDNATYSWDQPLGSSVCPTDNGSGAAILPASTKEVCTSFQLPIGVDIKNVVVGNAYWHYKPSSN